MKKIIVITICIIMSLSLSAGDISISIGTGYGIQQSYGNGNQQFHGPTVNYTGTFEIGNRGFTIIADGSTGFPLNTKASHGSVERKYFTSISWSDLMIGAGFKEDIANTPFSYTVGGGIYTKFLSARVNEAGIKILSIYPGIGLYLGLDCHLTDSWSIGLGISPSMAFSEHLKLSSLDSNGSAKTDVSHISLAVQGRISASYSF